MDIVQLVRTTRVGEAFPKRDQKQIVTLPASCTVQEAIRILAEAGVLSAPVKEQGGRYLGLVDMFDLLAELIRAFTECHKADKADVHLNWVTWVNDPRKLSTRGALLAEEPITFLISQDLSRRNPLRFVSDKAPVLELLCNFREGVHRTVMKENNTDQLLRIVSQSDMLRFIQEHLHLCGDWKDKPVSELEMGEGAVVSVNTNARALIPFVQMHAQGVSAVAVVDHQGILVGSLSVSDLRSLEPTRLQSLQLPVMDFLKQRSSPAPTAPVSCTATATLAEAIDLLVSTHVHRLWVVDEPWKRPVGLVSLTDIMKSLFDRVGGSEELCKM
jgi:CBS domain-containing protein